LLLCSLLEKHLNILALENPKWSAQGTSTVPTVSAHFRFISTLDSLLGEQQSSFGGARLKHVADTSDRDQTLRQRTRHKNAGSDTGLRWWRCYMSRVSGYVNDAMFAHNRSCEGDESIG